jgi:dienelactone hydrolase
VTDAIEINGFQRSTFSHDGLTHDVYKGGSGPAVVVVHEVPGLHAKVVEFARRVVAAGYTVYMPSLFGTPNAKFSYAGAATTIPKLCISREFRYLSENAPPAVTWLKALAAKAHSECGGKGVGAVGMCYTGGFALAMAVDSSVLASVMSEPAMPPQLPLITPPVGVNSSELTTLKSRARDGELKVLGLRFTQDPTCTGERFKRLSKEFGTSFEAVEINSKKGNPHGIKRMAHSVLTVDLVDEPGHPTHDALERTIEFLGERLR